MNKQSRYTLQIKGPHYEKQKVRQNYNHQKNDPLGPTEVEKIFVEILPTNYIFGVSEGFSSRKTQN